MVKHISSGDVGKTNHVIIQNVQVYWFKNTGNLLFQSLLGGSVCVISLNVFLLDVTRCANLGAVPSVLAGARPGAVGLTNSVGPASLAGAIMA
jgi:hypothetical protein